MLEVMDMTGWEIFAYSYVSVSIIANVIFTLIITIGGIFDLKYLFVELKKEGDKDLHRDKT